MNQPMNTQQLIENTVLYSLGFLDDQEQADYEAAILAAHPDVRAGVRAEAARMADLGHLLPDDQPAPELRDMVVAAVRAGMRESEVEQRIAAEAAAPAIAGRITRRPAQPALPRSKRVSPVWRAATIGLTAATIVLTVVSANIRNTYNIANDGARVAQLYDRTGAEFVDDTLFDGNTRRVVLTAASAETTNAEASVFYNPDWASARLFVKNLRPQVGDQPYRLVVLDADGNIVREVAEIRPTGEIQDIGVALNLSTESRLAIYQGIEDALDSQPLLRSTDSEL
tara:strand:+ start:2802 stop:3650 length:849 start_codon:yes stop_codon:yes gene_type:complete